MAIRDTDDKVLGGPERGAEPRPARRRVRAVAGPAVAASVAALAAASTLAPPPAAAQAPDADWRTLETEHLRVTFPAHLEALGREAAGWGEEAWTRLSEALVEPPGGRVELVLTDHTDSSNGFASVAPYDRVVVYASPPLDGSALSHFDDWLRLVVTHELAHVFHLRIGGTIPKVLRAVFGPVPVTWPFFPQLAAPRWTIEGLATWYESALTESGRVRGTWHDMIVRTAALEGDFASIDRASGASPNWPGGRRPYIYGSLFFDHLVERYGVEAVGDFVEAVGDQIVPYRLDSAAEDAFGVTFSEAWRQWREEAGADARALRDRLAERHPLTRPEPVTRGAREAFHAALDPSGTTLAYVREDGHSDPELRLARPDGSDDRKATRVNGSATFGWTPAGGLLWAQPDFAGPYRIYGDLWLRDAGGAERRVTRGARLDQPSPDPGGGTAVAIQIGEGTTRLVEVRLRDGAVRPLTGAERGVHWAWPAVSPDGRWIAASRWSRGAYFDVVVLDRSDGRVVAEVTRDRAVDLAPSWGPEGRTLVWTSDRTGVPNVLAAAVDPATGRPGPVRQVTNLVTGAAFASADPRGRWIHFSHYGSEGWELARVPWDPEAWFEPFPLDPRFEAHSDATAPAPEVTAPVGPYRALRTFYPRHWEIRTRGPRNAGGFEVLGYGIGADTWAEDAVGRHRLDAEVIVSTGGGEVDAALSYRWWGLGNPVLGVAVSQDWGVLGTTRTEDPAGDSVRLFFTERERSASVSATLSHRRWRRSLSLTAAGGIVRETRFVLDEALQETDAFALARPTGLLGDVRASLSFSSARGHAFSTGAEEGMTAFVQGRLRPDLDVPEGDAGVVGSDRGFRDALARLRFYQSFGGPGFSDHVLALQASGGAAQGPGADRFHFGVGGAPGDDEPVTGFALLGGTRYFFPIRGFPSGVRAGRYAWSGQAEYRFPLALVDRGPGGVLPLHLDRLAGTLFVDGGNAWGPELGVAGFQNPRGRTLSSAGAELLVDGMAFFIPLSFRVGAALGLTYDEALDPERPYSVYLRFGRSF